MSPRLFKFISAASGTALLAWLFTQVDATALLDESLRVGIGGFTLLVAIYGLEFLLDVIAWQLTLSTLPLQARWTARLFLVRLAGEAYNVITPFGGMGGEPVKALLLYRGYQLPYTTSGASLVLAKTMNIIALVIFLAIGFVLMLDDVRISDHLRLLASTGLAGLSIGILAFVAVQRLRLTSRLLALMQNRRSSLARLMLAIREFDQHLVDFYSRTAARFVAVLAFGIANWIVGALGVWTTMQLMHNPISFADAWIIEAMAQMVRASTFFIPASIGAQEGAIMLFTAAITGRPDSGLALALLRRAREAVWVVTGLLVSGKLLLAANAVQAQRACTSPNESRQ